MKVRAYLEKVDRLRTTCGRRFYILRLRAATGRLKVWCYPGDDPGDIKPRHLREILEDLMDRGQEIEAEVDMDAGAHPDLVGVRAVPRASGVALDSSPRRPSHHQFRCHECRRKFTDRDTSTVAIVVPTRTGCRRATVHQRCEDDAMDQETIGVF